MKKRRILAGTLAALMLAGCAAPKAPPELPTEALPKIAPADRCAATSMGLMAETEKGYYISYYGTLFYADKTDLTNWVPVCNKPNCTHQRSSAGCAALADCVWFRDGQIYTMLRHDAPLDTTDVVWKSPGDGSDWQPALSDPESPLRCGRYVVPQFYQGGACMNISKMGTDGLYDCFLYFIDDTGIHRYSYGTDYPDDFLAGQGNSTNQSRGDLTMYLFTEYPEPDPDTEYPEDGPDPRFSLQELYRVSPEAIEKLEFPEGCSYRGAYLSGDTMVHYHPNDGFYRLTLSTGKETKIADAACGNGFGYCLDGTILVETTVNRESTADTPSMRYFDGNAWIEVSLPEELHVTDHFRVVALTSDALFFSRSGEGHASILSMVRLGTAVMTDCMTDAP